MKTKSQNHFNWLNFLILSGAVAVNSVGSAEIAAPGSNPFINPQADVALFNGLIQALQASKEPVEVVKTV